MGHILMSFPYAYVSITAALRQVPSSLDEASASLGATHWQTFRMVTLPLIMPGVVGVFFSADQFSGQWLAVAGALLVGTFLSVLTTLLLMASLVKAGQRRASDD